VGLVRALVKQPKILILDEATAAMDYRMERAVMDLVRNYLHQTGAGLLLITHLYIGIHPRSNPDPGA
jgi:ABC-type methionine transport system ATPase subunit